MDTCCNCYKEKFGWTKYEKLACLQCKTRATQKAPADQDRTAQIAAAVAKAVGDERAAAAQKASAVKEATDQARAAEIDAAVVKAVAKALAEKPAEKEATDQVHGADIAAAAAQKASAEKAAAEAAVRRAKASNLEAWLRDMCEIDDDEERMEVLDAFVDPRYKVTSTPKLFSLDAEDIDTILAPLSLGTRKLIKNACNELRLHGEVGGGCKQGGGPHGNSWWVK